MIKIKPFITYLSVLMPLFFIGLMQNISLFNSDKPLINKINLNEKTLKLNDVVYRIRNNLYTQLNQSQQNDIVRLIKTEQQALNFLQRYLSLAKEYSNSAYAGFALSSSRLLPRELTRLASVQLSIADLLAYSHDFDEAVMIYKTIQQTDVHQYSATMKLMNIFMIKGQYKRVENECKKMKGMADYRIFVGCRLWLKGIRGNKSSTILALTKLQLIADKLTLNNKQSFNEYNYWLQQLVLDLQLKSDNVYPAIATLKLIYINPNADMAALIQVVDYLLLTHRLSLAAKLITEYDHKNELSSRLTLIKYKTNDVNLTNKAMNVAENKILNVIESNDTSKFSLVALWYLMVSNNFDTAKYYAKNNLKTYRTNNDIFLLKEIDRKRLIKKKQSIDIKQQAEK